MSWQCLLNAPDMVLRVEDVARDYTRLVPYACVAPLAGASTLQVQYKH